MTLGKILLGKKKLENFFRNYKLEKKKILGKSILGKKN